jgi:hypothetical protein
MSTVHSTHLLYKQIVTGLTPQKATPMHQICWGVADESGRGIEETYLAISDLINIGVLSFRARALLPEQDESMAAITISHYGSYLFDELLGLSISTKTLSRGDTMLTVLQICGSSTKDELFKRVAFVRRPSRYSYTSFALTLRYLLMTGRVEFIQPKVDTPVYNITQDGQARLKRVRRQ